MRHLRRLCLATVLATVLYSPSLVQAEGQCCQAFINHCDSFCSTHGGRMLADCLVCTDYCFCNDIDPQTQQHYIDEHTPPWCGGCEG